MEVILAIIGGGVGAGIMSIIQLCIQRKWQKQDKVDAIVNAEKLIMIDMVRRQAKKYIRLGEISLEEKEHLIEEYHAYKALGGNGHLDMIMNEINRLKVVDE